MAGGVRQSAISFYAAKFAAELLVTLIRAMLRTFALVQADERLQPSFRTNRTVERCEWFYCNIHRSMGSIRFIASENDLGGSRVVEVVLARALSDFKEY